MTDRNKRKGRPKGSEKDDSAALAAVADMILAEPGLRPTTAMRRYKKKAAPSEIRRWQVKWRERSATLLAEARGRIEARRQREVGQAKSGSSRRPNLAELAAMGRFLDTPAMRAARGLDLSPGLKALMDYQNSPAMRIMREIDNIPTVRLMREMESNPLLRAVREHGELIGKITKFL